MPEGEGYICRCKPGKDRKKLGKGLSASSECCYHGSNHIRHLFTKSNSVVFGVVFRLRDCRVVIGTVDGRLRQCRVSCE